MDFLGVVKDRFMQQYGGSTASNTMTQQNSGGLVGSIMQALMNRHPRYTGNEIPNTVEPTPADQYFQPVAPSGAYGVNQDFQTAIDRMNQRFRRY
jgi:hypothetical protein